MPAGVEPAALLLGEELAVPGDELQRLLQVVRDRVRELLQLGVGAGELGGALLELPLGLAVRRDVLEARLPAGDRSPRTRHGPCVDAQPDGSAGRVPHLRLEAVHRLTQVEQAGEAIAPGVGEQPGKECADDARRFAAAEQAHGGRAGGHDHPRGRERGDADRHLLDESAVALLADERLAAARGTVERRAHGARQREEPGRALEDEAVDPLADRLGRHRGSRRTREQHDRAPGLCRATAAVTSSPLAQESACSVTTAASPGWRSRSASASGLPTPSTSYSGRCWRRSWTASSRSASALSATRMRRRPVNGVSPRTTSHSRRRATRPGGASSARAKT